MDDRSNNKQSSYRWVMAVLLMLPFFAVNTAQYQLSTYSQEFMSDLSLNMGQFSAVIFSYSIANGILAAFGGALEDKYGVKRVMTVSGIVSAVCAFARLYATGFPAFFVLSMLIGTCAGANAAAVPKVVEAWFSEKETSTAMAIACAGGAIGISFAQLTGSLFSGYRQALMFSSVCMAAVTLLWALLGRNAPKGSRLPESLPVIRYIKEAGKSKNVWILACASALFAVYLSSLAGLLPTVLVSSGTMTSGAANTAAGMLNLGALAGSVVMPILQRKAGTYRPFTITILVIAGVCALSVMFLPAGFIGAAIFISGLFGGVVLSFFMAILSGLKDVKKEALGSAAGIVTMVEYIAGTFLMSNFLVAPLIQINSDLIYILNGAFCFLMAICVFLLPETGEKKKQRA